jgi:hypothetical protein
MADTFVPPAGAASAAKRALGWIADGKAGDGFTSTGRTRAGQLSKREGLSRDTIMRMVSFFARHEVDKKAEGFNQGEKGFPSAGRVAWDAWGGDAGKSWAESVASKLKKEKAIMANDFANSYAAIIKQEKQEDGSLLVYGKATDDSLDIDQQICDDVWLSSAMPEWFKSGGNIREQHSSIAAGVAKEYEAKPDGHFISVLVVDPVSVKKVESGVLKGFSIGIKSPRVVRDQKAANGRIIDGTIVEVSLVDRPANPNAKLMLAKSVEGEPNLVQVEELVETEPSTETTKGLTMEQKFTFTTESEEIVDDLITKADDMASDMASDSDDDGCTCDGCKACKADGGCDGKPCDKCMMAKSATIDKCLQCGCGMVGQDHGLSQVVVTGAAPTNEVANVSTATIVTPEQNAGSIKSAEGEEVVAEEVPAEEKADELVDAELPTETEILDEKSVKAILEKAVKSATDTVKAEIAEYEAAFKAANEKVMVLESELVAAKSAAIASGPKRTGRIAVTDTNELLLKAAEYRLKAAATSDQILAKGYKALEKEYLEKAETPKAE